MLIVIGFVVLFIVVMWKVYRANRADIKRASMQLDVTNPTKNVKNKD